MSKTPKSNRALPLRNRVEAESACSLEPVSQGRVPLLVTSSEAGVRGVGPPLGSQVANSDEAC